MQADSLPDTILYPDAFTRNAPASFDGVFAWEWVNAAFADTRITCTDLDGVIERNGHFLVFETKNAGVPIPKGQQITLDTMWSHGVFTIMLVQGKRTPLRVEVWPERNSGRPRRAYRIKTPADATRLVRNWRDYAEKP